MRPTGAKWYGGMGTGGMGHMANKAHRGYGLWGTGGMGHMGNGSHGGNGAHGQWGTWAIGTFLPITSLLLDGFLQKFNWT